MPPLTESRASGMNRSQFNSLLLRRLVEIACILLLIGFFAFHVAYRESHEGGFPFFSLRTWNVLWPWALGFVVLLAVRLGPLIAQKPRPGESDSLDARHGR